MMRMCYKVRVMIISNLCSWSPLKKGKRKKHLGGYTLNCSWELYLTRTLRVIVFFFTHLRVSNMTIILYYVYNGEIIKVKTIKFKIKNIQQ